jgi:hypothetical protein
MRRHRGEGGDQGSQDRGAVGVQRQIRRATQARWRLYSYFDFMQNRNFDIAGPNPTPEEQKQIDEQYTAYLDNQRRSSIAAAFAAKQQQLLQASLKSEGERASLTTGSTGKPQTAASDLKRMKATDCARHSFSCEWPRLSEGIKDLKKALFGSSSSKAKRS